jgi:hypothetical protein
VVVLVGLLWVVLAAPDPVAVLRPRLGGRARVTVTGGSPPHSPPYLAYVALAAVKVIAGPSCGSSSSAGSRRERHRRGAPRYRRASRYRRS